MKKTVFLLLLLTGLLVPWATQAQTPTTQQLTVYENGISEGDESDVPMAVYRFGHSDYPAKSQTIFPAEDIEAMTGGTITQIKFYTNRGTYVDVNDLTTDEDYPVYIYMTELSEHTISSYVNRSACTIVYTGTLTYHPTDTYKGEVVITLSTPYEYHGGNLLFGCDITSGMTSVLAAYKCIYAKGAAAAAHSSSFYSNDRLPKTTFTYIPPSCSRPTGLSVTAMSPTTATLSWTENGEATTWDICLNDDEDHLYTATAIPFTLGNLNPVTPYTVKVRANCGEGDQSGWSRALSFMPADRVTIGPDATVTDTTTHRALPINFFFSHTLSEQIYTVSELGNAGAIMGIDLFKVEDSYSNNLGRYLNIYMVSTDLTSFGSDWIPVTEDDLVYSDLVTFANNEWTTIEFSRPFNYDGNHNVAVVVCNNTAGRGGGNGNIRFRSFEASETDFPARVKIHNSTINATNIGSLAADSNSHWKNQMRFLKITCPPPANLTVSNVTQGSATLSWDERGEATSWTVEYSTSSNFENAPSTIVTSPTIVITGLSAGTQYYARVKSNCTGGSNYWNTTSFKTDCLSEEKCEILYELTTAPWSYGTWYGNGLRIVDNESGIVLANLTIGDFIYDWNTDEQPTPDTPEETDGSTYARGSIFVCNGHSIRFEWLRNSNADACLFSFYDADNNLIEGLSGEGGYIVDVVIDENEEENYIYTSIEEVIYTVSCTPTPCSRPTHVAVNYEGGTTAVVSWEGTASSYIIDVNGTSISNVTSPYLLEDLDFATSYTVKVQANCGNEDGLSRWSRSVSFATEICLPENMCEISYELTDANWNGWDGAAIQVVDAYSGLVIDTWTVNNSSGGSWEGDKSGEDDGRFASGSLRVCNGREIRFVWVSGDVDYECSFTVFDVNGNVLFASPENEELSYYNGQTIYTYQVNCTCSRPYDFAVNYTGGHTADVTWSGFDELYYIEVNGNVLDGCVTSPYTLENLDLATTYVIRVKSDCTTSEWTTPVSFTTDLCEDMCVISYELNDDYGDGWNGAVINVVDDGSNNLLATWTIESYGSEATEETNGYSASGTLRVCNSSTIRFEWSEGAYDNECSYIVYDGSGGVIFSGEGTMYDDETYMVNCGAGGIDANGWYAISAPYYDGNDVGFSIDVDNVGGLIPTETGVEYDLFRYNEVSAKWENQKESTETGSLAAGFSTLDCGRGYIYRRSASTVLSFDGNPYTDELSAVQTLTSNCSDADLKGFNLIGNPYQHSIYKGEDFDEDELLDVGYYSLNRDGSWLAHLDDDPIEVGQGVLVRVSGDNSVDLTFYDSEVVPAEPTKNNSTDRSLQLTVTGGDHKDVAFALFADREGLPKFGHLNAEAPSLSIPQGGTDYAIATINGSTQSFPLRFRSIVEDDYTLVVKAVSDFDYLHLIDKVAGRDIDLLRQPTYTFTHTGNQTVANRFTVKLSPYSDSDNGIFAYQNGDRIVVEGTGTLQVYDVLGRQLFTHEINSQFSMLNSQFPSTGVYILRLNGKSQKLVIK